MLQASGETNEQGGDPGRGPPLDWGKLTDSQQERIRCRLRRPPFRTRKRGGRVPDEIREADVKGFVQQTYTQTSYVVGPAAELAAQEQPQAPDQLADTRPHQPHQPEHVFRRPYSRTCPPHVTPPPGAVTHWPETLFCLGERPPGNPPILLIKKEKPKI